MFTHRQKTQRGLMKAVAATLSLGLASLATQAAPNQDPFEGFNRQVFAFNNTADRQMLRPVAVFYTHVTPGPVRGSVRNALSNLRDVNYTINALLQGRATDGFSNAGRVLVNSTLGLLGLVDVASEMGLHSEPADYGQTLATWGAPAGPYVVLPFLGPSTMRDTVGVAVDTVSLAVPAHVNSASAQNTLWGTATVDARSNLLTVDGLVTGDRYIFLRDAYLQRRNAKVGAEAEDDTFGGDDDFDWDEDGL